MTDPAPSVPRQRLVFFDYVTHFGGAQQSTVALCKDLASTYDVHVLDPYGVCREWLQAVNEARIHVRVLLPQSKRWFIGHEGRALRRIVGLLDQIPEQMEIRRRMRQALGRIKPDLILTNSTKALALLWTAGAFGRYRVVFYARGWYQCHQVPALGRWMIRRAHCILAVSKATATALQDWGVPEERIHVVYTLIDPDEFERNSRAPLTDRPPRADAPCRILLPAQLHRAKGQHTAVEAAGFLKDRGLDFVMWLAGDVKMGSDQRYHEDLVRDIARRGLQDRVILLGHRTDVPALMRLADSVILPTHSEGLPRAVWEAQILERPVVSTPAGGVTDLIEDGQTGLLVPVDDGLALAEAVERLWRDEALRRRIVHNAASQIRSKFSTNRQRDTLQVALKQTR